ncbi:hypothetical protein OIU34_24400 [Pararhizobium sp. BT-229]|uniref:hypothetical protein n=1 Tax=Pararhizobium sp. BT-229 TaxID=2986923 RepID=UPI0021F7B62E|nr:hypothetical protein [Pararhizobium sp. BT-229]MCV9965042.1 hypothetical protein [Pararhizobium sp. BT-229]
MTTVSAYDKIGPFKYVPENVRARVASLANLASSRSLDEALHASEASGGGYSINAYRPATAAVTSSWAEEEHVARVRGGVRRDTVAVALFSSIFPILSALFAIDVAQGSSFGLFLALVMGGAGTIIMAGGLYFAGYKETLRSRRELKTQGFRGDALIDVAVHAAGQTWLLGEAALVIAKADHKETSSTRTVFYDAIGTVTVTVEDGLEGVTVTGRDGLVIDRIAKPVGYQSDTAEVLASAIRQRAENARKGV